MKRDGFSEGVVPMPKPVKAGGLLAAVCPWVEPEEVVWKLNPVGFEELG